MRKGGEKEVKSNLHFSYVLCICNNYNQYHYWFGFKQAFVWITINFGKFWKRWKYQTTWPAFWEICMQVRKQQLELDMEQQDWFQRRKRINQGCILSPCLFNFYAKYIMRNTGLDEDKLESRLLGELSITSDMQMTPPLWQRVEN